MSEEFYPSNYEQVREFHQKFKLPVFGPVSEGPQINYNEYIKWINGKLHHIEEETVELIKAINDRNDHEILDAAVDLSYVLLGLIASYNYDFDKAFDKVHEANMSKIRQESKRSVFDIVKPPGFVAPDLTDCLVYQDYPKTYEELGEAE